MPPGFWPGGLRGLDFRRLRCARHRIRWCIGWLDRLWPTPPSFCLARSGCMSHSVRSVATPWRSAASSSASCEVPSCRGDSSCTLLIPRMVFGALLSDRLDKSYLYYWYVKRFCQATVLKEAMLIRGECFDFYEECFKKC